MIKLLSVKTRRPDSTREAFRRHYEEWHVPLGLGFIERFRWRRYVRNHVVAVHRGSVDFDCLTEFWFASRADQESTRAFAATPEFRIFDEDDLRFLDVSRRFSCELAESVVAGPLPERARPGSRKLAALFSRPTGVDPACFGDAIEAELRRLVGAGLPSGAWVVLDRREGDADGGGDGGAAIVRPGEFAAIVSIGGSAWSVGEPDGSGLGGAIREWFGWKGESAPVAVVELEPVETPARLLAAGNRSAI